MFPCCALNTDNVAVTLVQKRYCFIAPTKWNLKSDPHTLSLSLPYCFCRSLAASPRCEVSEASFSRKNVWTCCITSFRDKFQGSKFGSFRFKVSFLQHWRVEFHSTQLIQLVPILHASTVPLQCTWLPLQALMTSAAKNVHLPAHSMSTCIDLQTNRKKLRLNWGHKKSLIQYLP